MTWIGGKYHGCDRPGCTALTETLEGWLKKTEDPYGDNSDTYSDTLHYCPACRRASGDYAQKYRQWEWRREEAVRDFREEWEELNPNPDDNSAIHESHRLQLAAGREPG